MSVIKSIQPASMSQPVLDPFIHFVHHEDHYPKGNGHQAPATQQGNGSEWKMYYGKTIPGFPQHPHRGFETVTVTEKGFVDHTDGVGGMARYGHGDVQWLTAGKGTQHAEMFPLVYEDKDNPLHFFQIWLNLPASRKMVNPDYRMHWYEEMPVVTQTNAQGNKVTVKLVAGSFADKTALPPTPNSWAAEPQNRVGIYVVNMEGGTNVTFPKVSPTLTRMLLVFNDGAIDIDGTPIDSTKFVFLDGNQEVTLKNQGAKLAKVLLLEGEPINEPVAAYGPFVMNTDQEIRQAYADYERTQFGGWPHSSPDPVSHTGTQRYAKHPDGRVEYPPKG